MIQISRTNIKTNLQVFDEPLDRLFERSFLPSLDLRVAQITTNSEPMGATWVEVTLVTRCKFATAQDLVGLGLRLDGELAVEFTGIDQQRSLGCGAVFLEKSFANEIRAE